LKRNQLFVKLPDKIKVVKDQSSDSIVQSTLKPLPMDDESDDELIYVS